MSVKLKIITLFFFVSIISISQEENTNKITEKINIKIDSINQLSKESNTLIYPTKFTSPKYTNQDFYTLENIPDPKGKKADGFISDPNDYISAQDEFKLNKILWKIEKTTTAQVAIVIVKSISNEVPKDFAVKLLKKWGTGQSDKDNGLLILTVVDQRRTEFEVGYGLEPILTDVICHRIGTEEIVPYFKQGEYGLGLIAASERISQILKNPDVVKEIYSQNINHQNTSFNTNSFFYILILYLFVTLILVVRYYEKIRVIDISKEDFYDKYQDVYQLGKDMLGCLSLILFILFPIVAIFFSYLRKRKLKKYRYAPRFSRVNGKKLFLLNASDENQFLNDAQILEEKIKSNEYDVWVAEDESDILVLNYEGSSRKYSDCEECGYKTYGISSTKVTRRATYSYDGEKVEHYVCKNCHYQDSRIVIIPQLVESSSSSSSFGGGSSSSSSSSSWGGGSSGGGGAGVSW